MHVLGISAGTLNGNSEMLLKAALKAVEKELAGVTTSMARIRYMQCPRNGKPMEKSLVPMITTFIPGAPGSDDPDDRPKLYEAIMNADAIIVSSPVYSHLPPGHIKSFIDDTLGPGADLALASASEEDGKRLGRVPAASIDPRLFKPRVSAFIVVAGSPSEMPEQWTLGLMALNQSLYSIQATTVDQICIPGNGPHGSVFQHEESTIGRAQLLGRRVSSQLAKSIDEVQFLGSTQKFAKIDWIGSVMIAIGIVLFVVGLQWSGNPYSWSNGHVLGPFITGLCLLFLFAFWEWKGINEGILHHSLFRHRNLPVSIALVFVEGAAFWTINNFFVFELVMVSHVGSFPAIFRFAVLFATSIVTAILAGVYITWSKRVREPLVCGFLLLTIFPIVMVFYRGNLPVADAYGYAVIGGSALGVILTASLVAAQMSTPADQISLSSGLPTAARSLGGAVGLAVNNAIFNNTLDQKMPHMIAEAVLPLGLDPKYLSTLIGALVSQNQAAVDALPAITPAIIDAAVQAFTEAYRLTFRNLWIASACFAGVGVIG
ncbi:hypothetical protein yc1106_07680 [Curvularia clavata]|uniref:NADPH-dependent FMN reductase-like domain-containing protein n=1 Tax=Curvularia clavata TaxID=95742 RepID=A0A9Q9DWF4_CURCL|nr:hypothetical protein yc1106_07680 [Curvularia clavata]